MENKKPLTPEQYAAILWPGLFKSGWRELDPSDTFFQAACYCIKKSEEMLEKIEVYYK